MCQFKSAIVVRDERKKLGFRLLMSPWTESHEDLVTIHNLRDNRLNFARVEFTPESLSTAHQVETYKLRIDEERTPEWFDADMKSAVVEKLSVYIKSIIVTGDVCLLIGGQFVVGPGVTIETAKSCIINVLAGGTVRNVLAGGTVSDVRDGGTVRNVLAGGTVNGKTKGKE